MREKERTTKSGIKPDKKTSRTLTVSEETDMLTKKFLDGKTTIDEERRLYTMLDSNDCSAEQKALRSIIAPPTDSYDIETWLNEDESETYDSIVKEIRAKQRKTYAVKWISAAAAVIVAILVVGIKSADNSKNENLYAETDLKTQCLHTADAYAHRCETATEDANMAEKPKETIGKTGKTIIRSTKSKDNESTDNINETGTKTETATDMHEDGQKVMATDCMEDIMERMEHELNNVGDSVYLAHVEQIIMSDDRFINMKNAILLN